MRRLGTVLRISCTSIISLVLVYLWTSLIFNMSEQCDYLTKKGRATFRNEEERKRRFGGFQFVNDNSTLVYSGYYDDRDAVHIVKLIALLPPKLDHNYTCVLEYSGKRFIHVTGYGKHMAPKAMPSVRLWHYRHGYVICEVPADAGRPLFVSIHTTNSSLVPNNITVWHNTKKVFNLTRCVKAFQGNYSDVHQLVWNLEMDKILGVEKAFVYLEDQADDIVHVLRKYEEEGYVEIRNFSVLAPPPGLRQLMSVSTIWGELGSYNDCHLSQIGLSKYTIFHDYDEVLLPLQHANLVDLATDLIERNSKPVGGILFRNVFFPAYMNKTNVNFPMRSVAEAYNIAPLLYTAHYKMNPPWEMVKSLVVSERVDEMFIHFPEIMRKRYEYLELDPSVGYQCHYRKVPHHQMVTPMNYSNFFLGYSAQLATAVEQRFKSLQQWTVG